MPRPSTHSSKAAPTLPTLFVMEEGVEKIPVPMIRPTLRCLMSRQSTNRQRQDWYIHEECCRDEPKMPTEASGRSLREGKLARLNRSLGLQHVRRHLARGPTDLFLGAFTLGVRRAAKRGSSEQHHCDDRPEHDVCWDERLKPWSSYPSYLPG